MSASSRNMHRPTRIMRCWLQVCLFWIALSLALPVLAAPQSILVFGDSLSAAHGMPQSKGWVALMQKRLAERDADINVVNASVSGETSGGGRKRFDAALARSRADVVILELGGNDGLQVLDLKQMRTNLAAMIQTARDAGARVLLLGMRIPPNYGAEYAKRFHAVFEHLAEQYDTAYDPFFLEPIADDRANFQSDGIHPTAAVQPVLAKRVLKDVQPLLERKRQEAINQPSVAE